VTFSDGTCDDCGLHGTLILYTQDVWLCAECLRAAQEDDAK